MNKRKTIGVVGPRNTPIGEDHHNAKLTDAQVDQIRDLYDLLDDKGQRIHGYRKLAAMFTVDRMTIRDIVKYRRRACTPDAYKTIEVPIASSAIKPPIA